ncbi:MAG: hypothetical protein PVI26_02380 [Chitinispirillia bacterium]|jgi:hypothetical protein
MKKEKTVTEAGKEYTAAYKAQYTTKDLYEALQIYRSIVVGHPKSIEAEYSLTQIKNIANSVIPKQELGDTLWTMALNHVKRQ